MTCQNCGATVNAEDKFCPICGVSTTEEYIASKKIPRFCTHCGGRLTRSDRFCQRCGSPVEDSPDAQLADVYQTSPRIVRVSRQDQPSENTSNGKGGTIAALIVILLSGVILFGGYLLHIWHF